jgi:hypothetical protein
LAELTLHLRAQRSSQGVEMARGVPKQSSA